MGRRGRDHGVSTLVGELLHTVMSGYTLATTEGDIWPKHLAIRKLIEKISTLEGKRTSSTNAQRLGASDRFMTWMKDNGVDTDGIEICEFPGYNLGLKALKPFARDSNIINVPRKLIMTEECAKKSILGSFVTKDPILQLMPNITLVMFLLLEKFNPDSFWKPYIDILPESYDTALYYSADDLLELKGSPNFKPALKFHHDIARQYAYFYKQLENSTELVAKKMKKIFTYKEYCWAVSTVTTRLNIVPCETDENLTTTALIPLWDMCNHTSGEITTNFNVELNRAECFSLKDYKEGDQILIFYGKRTNAFFFLYNGFVYANNEHDALNMTLGISPNDPLEKMKKQLLEKVIIPATNTFQIVSKDVPLSPELLAFARIFSMDKDSITFWLERFYQDLKLVDCPLINPEIEKKAYAFINMRCKLLLRTYENANNIENIEKVKIEDDDNEIAKPIRNENHRLLVKKLKETEVKLFEKAIEYTQSKL